MTAVVMLSLLYAVFIVLSVESRDIQVVTQYSGFGESHFYKSPWYTLYLFAAMGIVIGICNVVAMTKLYSYERRGFGVYVGWVTILMIAVASVWTAKVFGVAYL